MKLLVLLAFLLPSGTPFAQSASPKLADEPPLATVTVLPDKDVFNLGEEIGVNIVLRAGPRGAYVSKWSACVSPLSAHSALGCGRHISGISGFEVAVLTLAGKHARLSTSGGFADRSGPPPSPKEMFEKTFVFLQPGQEVKWHWSADSSLADAGEYKVVGSYIPDDPQLADLATLPEARGLLISKPVESAAVTITMVK